MFILLFIILHSDGGGNSSTESATSVTAEFSTEQRCQNAAAKLYAQRSSNNRVMWACTEK